MRIAAIVTAALAMTSARAVLADEGDRREPAEKRYGRHVFLGDAAILPLGAAHPGVLGGLLFSGPIAHLAHGNPRGAGKSFGLRAGLGLGAALVSWGITETRFDNDNVGGKLTFVASTTAVAVGVAMVIDYSVLARKDVPRDAGARDDEWGDDDSVARRLRPSIAVERGGVRFGLGASF